MLDSNLVLKSNELYLVGNIATDGSRERATGLYLRDTRHLNRFAVGLNGARPEQLRVRLDDATHATITGANPLMRLDDGTLFLPQQVLVEQRVTLDDALGVRIELRNFSRETRDLTLGIELAADFRDLFDIRGFVRSARGAIVSPKIGEQSVVLAYRALDGEAIRTRIAFDRPAEITVTPASILASNDPVPRLPSMSGFVTESAATDLPVVMATFRVRLVAGEGWSLNVTVTPVPAGGQPVAVLVRDDERRGVRIETDDPAVNRVLRRSLLDLDELQTTFPQGSLPAAGVPWFVAPFGRDSVISGLQTLHLAPERAIGTLRVLAALQGTRVDPAKEEVPGKILHEMRYGEMARLHEVPHTPYFGTVDATPLFVWLFAETVLWTGDRQVFAELLSHAERALDWCEQHGDLDGDGLIEYRSDLHGAGRITNQVWKDSQDSLNHEDGGAVLGPVAAVEVQGYLYAAYARMADAFDAFGEVERAKTMRARAERVRALVEERFWMPEAGFYAQALDKHKRQVRALTSNPGHLFLAGLPSAERAAELASRLAEPRFDSGWGIRTLAADAVTYNPMSYHNGSVWPHDNSLIGAGALRYGQAELGNRIFRHLLDAALTDPIDRLPELFCGFPREHRLDDEPVRYPVSCSPQAWAAGAPLLLMRAMLGLAADPVARKLVVRPVLPEWLTWVRIDGLRVFDHSGWLLVARDGSRYRIESEGLPLS